MLQQLSHFCIALVDLDNGMENTLGLANCHVHRAIYLSVCLSIHPPIYLLTHQFIHTSVHSQMYPFIYTPIHPCIHQFIHPFIYPSVHPPMYLPTPPSIYSSIHRPIQPTTHSSTCTSIHLSIHPPTRPPIHFGTKNRITVVEIQNEETWLD